MFQSESQWVKCVQSQADFMQITLTVRHRIVGVALVSQLTEWILRRV